MGAYCRGARGHSPGPFTIPGLSGMPAAWAPSIAAVPPGSSLSPSLERELGSPGVSTSGVTGIGWIDDWEEVPELRWPSSVAVYDRMRRDAQVRGCLRAVIGPILSRANFHIGTEGVDPRVAAFCRTELGLIPERQSRARRRRQGISWDRYAREALTTKSWAGHAVFEQVYEIGAPNPDQAETPGMPAVVGHLRKLGPRPPRSLGDPVIAPDGGLEGWKQNLAKPGRPWETITLPIDRLVVHVNEQEGADWRGQSMLRPAWKHWAIRDVLMRVGAIAVERNGMGIPVVEFDEAVPGVTRARAIQLAKAVRAGDEAAVALPTGYTLSLIGVAGQVRDELPLLKYHGEEIGRAFTAMVLDLGHDAGARALGDTYLALLCMAQNGIADEFAEEVTEYVIRDLVELTFGVDEPYPPLLFDELTPDTLTPEDLARFATSGLVIPDDSLELELRRRAHLPAWPGAPDGAPDFGLEGVLPLDPTAPPGPMPVPPPGPAPAPDVAARLEAEAAARLEALVARSRARAAARGPRR